MLREMSLSFTMILSFVGSFILFIILVVLVRLISVLIVYQWRKYSSLPSGIPKQTMLFPAFSQLDGSDGLERLLKDVRDENGRPYPIVSQVPHHYIVFLTS